MESRSMKTIERVATAICNADVDPHSSWIAYMDMAKAAISAMAGTRKADGSAMKGAAHVQPATDLNFSLRDRIAMVEAVANPSEPPKAMMDMSIRVLEHAKSQDSQPKEGGIVEGLEELHRLLQRIESVKSGGEVSEFIENIAMKADAAWALALLPSLLSLAEQLESSIVDYEKVLSNYRRLVRKLNVAMNGERGAAEQASLCDLIGPTIQIQTENALLRAQVKKLEAAAGRDIHLDKLREMAVSAMYHAYGTKPDHAETLLHTKEIMLRFQAEHFVDVILRDIRPYLRIVEASHD